MAHKILKEETIALNVMLPEQKVKKGEVVAMKFAVMQLKVSFDFYIITKHKTGLIIFLLCLVKNIEKLLEKSDGLKII